MPTPVVMPQLGEAITEGTIGRWLKAPGERVEADEPLLEIMTDKVTTELTAPVGGILQAALAAEGASVAVGATVAMIAAEGEAAENQPAVAAPAPTVQPPAEASPAPAAPAPAALSTDDERAATVVEAPPAPAAGAPDGHPLRSPRVRALAAEHDLGEAELAVIAGSGLGGRLTAKDVLDYLARRPTPTERPAAPPAEPARLAPASAAPPTEAIRQPLTPMRRAIATQMERATRTATPAWLSVEIDMSAVVRARARQRAAFEAAEGFGLTYLPFFTAATIQALRAHPALCAVWEGDELRPQRALDLGVAVALDDGLVVPVIPAADGLSLTGLARSIHDLAERARAIRLTAADLRGGVFTVNNTGAVGSILSQPIINAPQVAILTMEAIVRRPVVIGDDAIAIRPLMNACLSYDARAVVQPQAAAFLADLARRLAGWPEAD